MSSIFGFNKKNKVVPLKREEGKREKTATEQKKKFSPRELVSAFKTIAGVRLLRRGVTVHVKKKEHNRISRLSWPLSLQPKSAR